MHNFWPQKSSPKGFSIEKLAKAYREKIAQVTHDNSLDSSYQKTHPITSPSNLIEIKNIREGKTYPGHWANRDFNEYRKIA